MVLNPNFFLPGTDHSWKVQARMEDKVRIKNLKSLLAFFEKFGRDACTQYEKTGAIMAFLQAEKIVQFEKQQNELTGKIKVW